MLVKPVSVHSWENGDINISPNPFDTYFNVNIKEDKSMLNMYDLSGKLVFQTLLEPGLNIIPTDNVKNGSYIVKVIGEKSVHKQLIIK
jgi:hypothetical protein